MYKIQDIYLRALRSTKTVVGSGEEAPWRQMAMFCRQPKEVETARGERPSGEKRVVKLNKMSSRFWSVLNFNLSNIRSVFTCCKEQSLVVPQRQQQEFERIPTPPLGFSAAGQNHPVEETDQW